MLNRASIPWSIKQMVKMFQKGTVNFDIEIQRGFTWEVSRRSGLIHSIMEGYPIPPFYARKGADGAYSFLDGKQRLMSIILFKGNEYELEGIEEVTLDDGTAYDPNGKTFENLCEEIQDRIDGCMLTINYYESLTDDEVRIMFKKLNSGKPLSTKDRNLASCVDLKNINEIGKHPFFEDTLTDKAKESRKYISLTMKLYEMMMKSPADISFDSKDFNDIISSISTTEDERKLMVHILDKAHAIWSLLDDEDKAEKAAKKKLATETHLISLVPFLKRALDENVSDELFRDFLKDTYGKKTYVSERYMAACRAGSAKTQNIVIRNDELEKSWEQFFAVDDDQEQNQEQKNDQNQEQDQQKDQEKGQSQDQGQNQDQEQKEAEAEAETETEEEVETTSDGGDDVKATNEFYYGMRLRGFSPGCQPMDGLLRREESVKLDAYYDILVYSRELTEEELSQYELDIVYAEDLM